MRTTTKAIMFSVTAAFYVAGAAAPSAARGPTGMTTIAPETAAASVAAQKVCMVQEPMTGSRLSRKICKSRAEWEAEGYTVTTKAKAKADAER